MIYHTSDLHDRRHIVAPLRALRARENGLLVDCGDSLRGSQTVFYRREPIGAEIDAAGYDLQAMGNREFHYVFGAVRARAALVAEGIELPPFAPPAARDDGSRVVNGRPRF